MTHVDSLHIYPLKSGSAVNLASVRVEAEGLAGDRRLAVVDPVGRAITARASPALMRIHTLFDGDDLVFTAANMPAIAVLRAAMRSRDPVSVWGDQVEALDGGDEIADWLSQLLGERVRLAVKAGRRSFGSDGQVSLADTAPLLLTNAASLTEVNRYLETPAGMARFRPNVVISGAMPFDEDGWARLRIGNVEFSAAGPCDRCVMVTLDPDTGDKRADHEPLSMLSRIRRGEDGKPYFGQFLAPLGTGRISAGDKVEILARQRPVTILPPKATPVTRLPHLTIAPTPVGQRHRERLLRCIDVVDETVDMRTFRFIVEQGAPFEHKPGQFMTLLPRPSGTTARRNYTISSPPSRPHTVEVTIKRQDGVSAWLHENLKPGSHIDALGPNGRFHLAAAGEVRKVLFLSAGSGVTPMISMLRFIFDTGLDHDVHFHHSARSVVHAPFADELQLMQRRMNGRLRLSWNLTGPAAGQATLAESCSGRLDADMLARLCPDLTDRIVFCCGPDGFRDLARQAHTQVTGRSGRPFLEETFGSHIAPGELPAIGAYSVRFEQSQLTQDGTGAVTILELARRSKIDLPSDCEAGICGSCKCRIVSGDWRLAANAADPERSALSDEDKAAGYVLACSTNPVGNVVVDL